MDEDDIDIRAVSIAFEGRKVSMNQNKDGLILRLAIHPNDVPTALIQDWVGSRYMVAMTKLGDDDQPEGSEYIVRANKAVQQAGMLARNPKFQEFVARQHGHTDGDPDEAWSGTEDTAVAFIREVCGVQSRTEFRTNKEALEAFEDIRGEFEDWVRR